MGKNLKKNIYIYIYITKITLLYTLIYHYKSTIIQLKIEAVIRTTLQNAGMGCHFLLQGIFQTQGSNLYLLHWQDDSLPLSYLGSPSENPNSTCSIGLQL